MYEKFSQRVATVVKDARELADEADQEYLGTEHVLLAILREGTGVGSKLLTSFGIDEYRLKAEIERFVKKSLEDTCVFGDLPGSPHLKSTVANAISLAQELDSKEVCTEHLLLAMLKEPGSVAERALDKFGVNFENARARAREILAQR